MSTQVMFLLIVVVICITIIICFILSNKHGDELEAAQRSKEYYQGKCHAYEDLMINNDITVVINEETYKKVKDILKGEQYDNTSR